MSSAMVVLLSYSVGGDALAYVYIGDTARAVGVGSVTVGGIRFVLTAWQLMLTGSVMLVLVCVCGGGRC